MVKYKNQDLGLPGRSKIQRVKNPKDLDMGFPENHCFYNFMFSYLFIRFYIRVYFSLCLKGNLQACINKPA